MARAAAFRVAIPSWGVGTGGTRFARFPGPRRAADAAREAGRLRRGPGAGPGHARHLAAHPVGQAARERPGRRCQHPRRLLELGLSIDSMNSNTFQDQPGQPLSYKFGSLSHTDAAVRRQAIEHNLECLAIGRALGATLAHRLDRRRRQLPRPDPFPPRARSLRRVAARDLRRSCPEGWRLFIEHKFYEPAFYSTVLNDWGTSYLCARAGRRSLPVARRSRPPRAERQHRADRRPADPARRPRRLPLQRQQVRRRRPRHRIDQAVPAVPGLQRAGRRRARGRRRASRPPTCSTSRTTSPIRWSR